MSRIIIGHPLTGDSDFIAERMRLAAQEGLSLIVVLPDGRPMFRKGIEEGADEAFRLIEDDPHQWSTRPCPTCRVVTSLIGRAFGCNKAAEQARGGEA